MRKDGNGSGPAGGIGFFGLIAIVFVTLKLCKVISWSWLWVLAPLWAPVAVVATGVVVYAIYKILRCILKK